MSDFVLHEGDCLATLRTLPDCSIDAVCTDPPYALVSIAKRFGADNAAPAQYGRDGAYARASAGFMGKKWDTGEVAFSVEFWAEVLRVLKPGGHVVAMGGDRTFHRLACAIEDAGFEIRGSLAWIFGTGFPKNLNVSKQIDKAAGVEREVIRLRTDGRGVSPSKIENHGTGDTGIGHADGSKQIYSETASATDAAKRWDGWGTALKPAMELICLARKPLSEGTVAANVLRWGTGALNIDGTRIEAGDKTPAPVGQYGGSAIGPNGHKGARNGSQDALGRWPANVVHDGSDEVVGMFPVTASGLLKTHHVMRESENVAMSGKNYARSPKQDSFGDSGSAARFFYSAKASKHDRCGSRHPTVKPVNLMRWLVRLVTPPGGTVLDPFAGSGTTGLAARLEGFRSVMCEREAEYIDDIKRRMATHADLLTAAE